MPGPWQQAPRESPRRVLSRLALGQHPSLRILPGDTVVLSSHTIPGNEELIHRVINRLFQKGADVIYHPCAGPTSPVTPARRRAE